MAQWSDTTKHSADSFNGGNQYTKNDQMSIEALNNNIENSLYAVRVAENVQSGANNPVSYNSQTPTSAEQNQAQKNIGVDRLFVKQGVADINNCSTYDALYNALANSPNGTGVGSIGYSSQAPIRTLLPTIPFSANFVNVYAKIIAGTDANYWAIELYTIDLYSNGQTIPTYRMQIGKNIVDSTATYRVSKWYNPAGQYNTQKGIVTWSAAKSHTQPILFPEAFDTAPTIVCTAIGVDASHASNICGLTDVTNAGFTVTVYGIGTNDKSIGVHWIAIGE